MSFLWVQGLFSKVKKWVWEVVSCKNGEEMGSAPTIYRSFGGRHSSYGGRHKAKSGWVRFWSFGLGFSCLLALRGLDSICLVILLVSLTCIIFIKVKKQK
jgi:hypothetical protein